MARISSKNLLGVLAKAREIDDKIVLVMVMYEDGNSAIVSLTDAGPCYENEDVTLVVKEKPQQVAALEATRPPPVRIPI